MENGNLQQAWTPSVAESSRDWPKVMACCDVVEMDCTEADCVNLIGEQIMILDTSLEELSSLCGMYCVIVPRWTAVVFC